MVYTVHREYITLKIYQIYAISYLQFTRHFPGPTRFGEPHALSSGILTIFLAYDQHTLIKWKLYVLLATPKDGF
jgi:hypothetical protein